MPISVALARSKISLATAISSKAMPRFAAMVRSCSVSRPGFAPVTNSLKSACISGMFPLKDPQDQYGADITTYDKLEIDIDFNADYVWHEPWVKTRCSALATTVHGDSVRVDTDYGQAEPSV